MHDGPGQAWTAGQAGETQQGDSLAKCIGGRLPPATAVCTAEGVSKYTLVAVTDCVQGGSCPVGPAMFQQPFAVVGW